MVVVGRLNSINNCGIYAINTIAGDIEYIEVENIDKNKVFTTDGNILPLNKLNAMLLGIVVYKIKQCDIMLSCGEYEKILKDINKWLEAV